MLRTLVSDKEYVGNARTIIRVIRASQRRLIAIDIYALESIRYVWVGVDHIRMVQSGIDK